MKLTGRGDLWKLLADVPGGDAAELGVAEGLFSADLLRWPAEFPRVYLVDSWRHRPGQRGSGDGVYPQSWHWRNRREALRRVAPFGARAVVLRMDTTDAAALVPDRSLSFLCVDADHSLEGVQRDIADWTPKMLRGGVVAFHDYTAVHYGVRNAVGEFAAGAALRVGVLGDGTAWVKVDAG